MSYAEPWKQREYLREWRVKHPEYNKIWMRVQRAIDPEYCERERVQRREYRARKKQERRTP